MGILFIINAKTLVNNIRLYYAKYFGRELIFLQITLILSALSYLLRATYLLTGFVLYEEGIVYIEKLIKIIPERELMLMAMLTVVSLTELLPLASLLLTNAFILKQRSMIKNTIGEDNHNLLEEPMSDDSDLDGHRPVTSARVKSIRSLLIDEFIYKDEKNSQYNYHMKDKQAGREIFWTYHFFEYIDDYIDSNAKSETIQDKGHTDEDINDATQNFELMANSRKQQRVSSRRRKEMMKQLDKDEEERCNHMYSSVSSKLDIEN